MNFFSLGHKITTALTQQLPLYSAEQANRHLLFHVPVDAKSSLTKVRKDISSVQRARFVSPFEKSVVHHDWIQRHTDHRESNLHTKKVYRVDRGAYIDSPLRALHDAYKAARSASSNRDGGLADRVLKDTTITKRQLDLAARMMLEQVSLLSNGVFLQSTMPQRPLDCVDRAAESTTAFISIRHRPMHSEDN